MSEAEKAKKGADAPRSTASPTVSQYAVVPNKSLGPFVLGMPVGAAIKKLSDNYLQYKNVDFVFSDKNPLSLDLVLNLTTEGIQLRFDPYSQRLKLIDVFDPKRVTLTYGGTLLYAAGTAPVMSELYHKIGPSTGQHDVHNKAFVLKYPGLALWFPVPHEKEHKAELDLTDSFVFSDGSVPVLSNLCVFFGSDMSDPQLPPLLEPVAGAWAPHYFEEVLVSREGELDFTVQKKKVRFGDSCQDVLLELGPPDEVFYKSEDKMRMHAQPTQALPCADYIYNYFSLGVDILFDCQKHTAKKFILHTNQPAHFDFNRYAKCNFRLQLGRATLGFAAAQAADRPAVRHHMRSMVVDEQPRPITLVEGVGAVGRPRSIPAADDQLISVDLSDGPIAQSVIDPDCKWDEAVAMLQPLAKAVKLLRPPVPNTVDPFGHTLLHHTPGMIFEVLRNNHIATVTFYQPL